MNDQDYDYEFFCARGYFKEEKALRKWSRGIISKSVKILRDRGVTFKKGKACDIGCGLGITLDVLKEYGFEELYGFDVSKYGVEVCKKKGYNAFLHDIHNPLPIKQFDLITCFNVLEHLKEPHVALKNISDALNSNGVFLAITPSNKQKRHSHDSTHISEKCKNEWGKILKNYFIQGYVSPVHYVPSLWHFQNQHIFVTCPEIISWCLLIIDVKK